MYYGIRGIVTEIQTLNGIGGMEDGCFKRITIRSNRGEVINFMVSPNTYFVDQARVNVGARVEGFYDGDAPTVLIFPPQYNAIAMTLMVSGREVAVGRFNRNLVSQDLNLQLNIGRSTDILLTNGQPFEGNLTNRLLVVVYGPTTRSIPAQTTPQQIIVICEG